MPRELRSLGDEQLAERARAGDARAFGVLWERHARAGRAAARQFSSIADPDDLVAEAYLQILRAVQRGGGPHEAFRPYLYRTIRNIALRWRPGAAMQPLDDAIELADESPGPEPLTLQRTITIRAFRSLPERWQTVLWYTEVEGMQPAEAAPHLGLSANGAAALAYRAREGLKAAWLQAHVNDARVPEGCRWAATRMGDRVRGALSARQQQRFDTHVNGCARCSILVEEVDELSGRLASFVLPLALGGVAGSALLSELLAGGGTAAHAAAPREAGASTTSSTTTATAASGTMVTSMVGMALAAVTVTVIALASLAGGGQNVPVGAAEPPSTPIVAPLPDPPEEPNVDDSDNSASASKQPSANDRPGDAVPQPDAPAVTPPVVARPRPPAMPTAPPTPPSQLVIAQPRDDDLVASSTVLLTGSGTAGQMIDVRTVDGDSASASIIVGRTVVSPEGTWMLTTSSLPDGDITLEARESTSADPPSAQRVRLRVDTRAAPPQVDSLETTELRLLPIITGSAEPSSIIELSDENSIVISTARAGLDGAWSVLMPDPYRDGSVVAVAQTDAAGNRSKPTPIGPFSFQRPAINDPLDGSVVVALPGGTAVAVSLSGDEGRQVQVLIDNVATGNIHTLQASPIVRVTRPLTAGVHTIGVRYIDRDTGRWGSLQTVTFVLE